MSDPGKPTQSLVFRQASGANPVVGVRLKVEGGPDAGKAAQSTTSTLTVGTSPSNDLVLSDPAVSRSHLALHITPQGMIAEDLQTKNGTWVGETRIMCAFVPDGAQLSLGQTTVRVEYMVDRTRAAEPRREEVQGILTRSAAMRKVLALVKRLAHYDVSVAISGETGTGKELIAQALHREGPRSQKPYQVLDCGAVVKELLASELFGHSKGAFTGADQPRKGIFETAAGGTVFLDEIAELDAAAQTHLLRVLESRQVVRLGSQEAIPVDFRLVCATHKDLEALVRSGQFRQDLYYRVAAVTLSLPALRDRPEDVTLLMELYLRRCAERNKISVPALDSQASELLEKYEWPGNVRELRNVADRLCVLTDGAPIMPSHVNEVLRSKPQQVEVNREAAPSPSADAAVGQSLESGELRLIMEAVVACNWNLRQAAARLGISRSSLYERLLRHDIRRPPKSG